MIANHQKKKELLQTREDLLEEIGRDVFARGEFPAGFEKMPEEFEEIDVLNSMSQDQKTRLLGNLEEVEAQRQLAEEQIRVLDLKRKNQIDPITKEREQLNLKLKEEHGTLSGAPPELASMARIQELNLKLASIKEAFADKRSKLKEDLNLAERRMEKLKAEIGQLDDERQQLQLRKKRRFVELGRCVYDQRIHQPRYAAQHDQVATLDQQLAQVASQAEAQERAVKSSKLAALKWVAPPVGLAVIILVVLLLLRSSFAERQLPYDALAHSYAVQTGETRLYWTADYGLTEGMSAMLPDLAGLPGPPALDQIEKSDLSRVIFSRAENGGFRFFGCQLDASSSFNLASELTQAGWVIQAVPGRLEALTDNTWSWIIFDERSFLLMPRDDVTELDALLDADPVTTRLFFRTPFHSGDNNRPLIQGFDTFVLDVAEDTFRVTLEAQEALADFDLRNAYLQAMKARQDPSPLSYTLTPKQLEIQGPMDLIEVPQFDGEAIEQFVETLERPVLGAAAQAPADDPPYWQGQDGPPAEAMPDFPQSDRQVLLAFRQTEDNLKLLNAVHVGASIRDVVCAPQSNRLILADAGESMLIGLQFLEHMFVIEKKCRFGDDSDEAALEIQNQLKDFSPGMLALSPSGAHVAVLEWNHPEERAGRVVLADAATLRPLWVEPLPDDAREALCCAWDPDGSALYVGLSGLRRNALAARAVVAYKLDQSKLNLLRTMDLPVDGRRGVQIGAIQVSHRTMYALNLEEGSLARYDLAREMVVPLDRTLMSQLTEMDATRFAVFHADGHALTLDRSGKMVLVLDRTDFSDRRYGSKVFLTDLDAERPVTIDVLETDGMPFSAIRLPLSNRFWVSLSNRQALIKLQIQNRGLTKLAEFDLGDFSPQHMACSRLGDYLFVTGQTPSSSRSSR